MSQTKTNIESDTFSRLKQARHIHSTPRAINPPQSKVSASPPSRTSPPQQPMGDSRTPPPRSHFPSAILRNLDQEGWTDGESYPFEDHSHESTAPNAPDSKAIPSPLGMTQDQDPRSNEQWCGQPAWAFSARSAQVPVGSYYEDWIWNALHPTNNETSVELYISAQPLEGVSKTRLIERKDGSTVSAQQATFNNPVFSYDHHCLMNVPRSIFFSNDPWQLSKRVLLIPVSYKETEVRPYRNATPFTERTPNIAKAQAMLWGKDTTLHVIHGRCLLSFLENDGSTHQSEYWVVLPKEDLKRMHAMSYGSARQRMEYGQQLNSPSVELPPAERFLGVWEGDSARYAYYAAKNQTGAVMPSDWQPSEVARLNQLHLGKIQRKKDRAERTLNENAIVSPLKTAVDRERQIQLSRADLKSKDHKTITSPFSPMRP